jgi:hypothetical protein
MPNDADRAGTPAGVFGPELRYYRTAYLETAVEGQVTDSPSVAAHVALFR